MDEIRIRLATPADIPQIVEHRQRMFAEMRSGTSATRDAMAVTTATYLREAMPHGRYRGWLAETADAFVVAGVGVAFTDWPGSPEDPAPRRGWVINVYTEPAFRRRGISQGLMEELLAWCRSEKLGGIALHASESGRPLYERLGFVATNEMRLRFTES